MKPDDTHFLRAFYAVPPQAHFVGFKEHGDHLRVTYRYDGARRPLTISVSL